jgi:two-component system OmpR family response regulator
MAKILIIEDDLDTRDLVCRYLKCAGHQVRCVSEGSEALTSLDEWPVDLILLDMMMPGMDGTSFLKALRASGRHAETKVLVCSALERDQLTAATKRLGVAGVLSKIDGFFIDLVEAVARQLRIPSQEPA